MIYLDRAGGVVQVVSKHEALSSNPNITEKKKTIYLNINDNHVMYNHCSESTNSFFAQAMLASANK
jgi:hypothetical protein